MTTKLTNGDSVEEKSQLEKIDPSQPSLHDLSDDALRRIFFLLPHTERLRLECVCKRWESLLGESWKTIRQLRLADFQVEHQPQDVMEQFLGPPETRRKVLKKERISVLFSRNLLCLEAIDFRDIEFLERGDFAEILTCIAESKTPNLKELNFCRVVLDNSVIPFVQLFPTVEKLNVDECFYRTFTDEQGVEIENLIREVFKTLTSLRELTISGLYGGGRCLADVPQSVVRAGVFRSFTAGWGAEIQLNSFFSVPRYSLTELRLMRCRVLPESSDTTIFVNGAPNLRLLDMSYTVGFRNFKALAGLGHLEELYLNSMFVPGDEPGTKNNEDDTENPFLYHLARSESRNSLKVLHMNLFFPFCSDRDQNLEEIGRLSRLKELSLEHCKQLDPGKIELLTQGCVELECLLLHHGISLDDTALATIGRQSPNLRFLDIARCKSVTSDGINALVSGLETSTRRPLNTPLEVYCQESGVGQNGLDELLEGRPWLKINSESRYPTPRQYDRGGVVNVYPDPCDGLVLDGHPEDDDDWFTDSEHDEIDDLMDDLDVDDPDFYPHGYWGYDSFDDGDEEGEDDPDYVPWLG